MRVLTGALDHGHDVCDAQAAGNLTAGVSLFTCFINIQKAYDTVDRTLPWKVLPRIGLPLQMIAVIESFND